MSQTVLTIPLAKQAPLKEHYQQFFVPNKSPYVAFAAKKNGVMITAYTSGKVMFQGNQAETEAHQWQSLASGTAPGKKTTNKKAGPKPGLLPSGFANWSVIGSDEVGNGSYFGPLVVCAVYAAKEHLAALQKLGVKDSKMLTDVQIKQLAPQIEKLVPAQKLVVTPAKYNQVQPRYNAVHMKVALHNQALYLLLQKIAPTKPEGILIDQFTPEANYRKYLQGEQHPVTDNLYFITKGEQYHLAVAAASILCRAAFLEALAEGSREVGLQLPSGAGAKSDQVAAELLKKGGLPLLGNYAKLHFANTKKAQDLAKR